MKLFNYITGSEDPNTKNNMEKDNYQQRELTYGEKAVGLTLNPSNNAEVDACKRTYADIIDALNNTRNSSQSAEVKRMCSIAITEAQSSQMWAVKAITWKD